MIVFPFTKKKFLSLSSIGQHKWIIKWLSEIYQGFIANRIKLDSFELFFLNYTQALSWIGETKHKPDKIEKRILIEFISDAIHFHRVQANLSPKDCNLLPYVNTQDIVYTKRKFNRLNYHMALDGIRSLFNIGSIFRVCDASGFKSLILGNSPGGEHPSVQKTSMGSSEWMDHEKTYDLASNLIKMKKAGFRIIGVDTIKLSEQYFNYSWPKKGVIVFGNEEYGISSHVMRVCDDFVHIPMSGRKNSINVACAASVIAFHVSSIFEHKSPAKGL